MVTRETEVRKTGSGKRDNEVISGFDHYHRLACKLAHKRYRPWFPTSDDLTQAAALAAMEAEAQLGSETTLKLLCRALDRSIYQQATTYGLGSTTISKTTTRTHKNIRREYCLCEVVAEDSLTFRLEYHRGAIGVGQFTAQATRQLHRLVNLPDPLDIPDQRKEALRARMYQVLESDPQLRALRDWYLNRNHHFGYRAMEREGLCNHNQGQRLIERARRLAGVAHSQHDLAMAQKVTTVYQAATDKRTRQLAQQLDMSQPTVQKWLTLARSIGLLPPYKSTQRQQITGAYQAQPMATIRKIA